MLRLVNVLFTLKTIAFFIINKKLIFKDLKQYSLTKYLFPDLVLCYLLDKFGSRCRGKSRKIQLLSYL